MAIAYDSVSVKNEANVQIASPATWTHTCTGSNLVLLVGIKIESGKTIGAVTYNGVAMSQLVSQDDSNGHHHYIYGLVGPATGANTVSVAWTGGDDYATMAGVSYTGVSQSGLPDATEKNTTAAATSISDTITTVANNCWAVAYAQIGPSIAAGTGTTARNLTGLGNQLGIGDSNGAITPAGGYSMAFTGTSAVATIVLVSIAPAIAKKGGAVFFQLL